MAVQVQCPNPACRASYSVSTVDLGRPRHCLKCGQEFAPSAARGPAAGPESTIPSASPARASELAEGARFGRYRILRRLGRGGMGTVYLAQDSLLHRAVALKIPHFAAGESTTVFERFFREARALARLDHPNICPVHDVGQVDGIPFLTMPFVDGRPLSDLVAEPLPERRAAEVVRTLARALAEAHARGIIHRDLKPSNVLIGPRLELVVIDFGLAWRDEPGEARLTGAGSILGTPAYMAPEQIDGELGPIGPGCDIYALGVILYELLTGRPPFEGSASAIMVRVLAAEPLPPSESRPGLTPRLEAICRRAMAKRISDRYDSMDALAEALDGYLCEAPPAGSAPATGGPAAPSPGDRGPHPTGPGPGAPPPLRTPARRLRWVAAGLIASGLLCVAIRVADVTRTVPRSARPAPPTPATVAPPPVDDPPAQGPTNTLGMRLVLIPAGEFPMGSPGSDPEAETDETPQHRVRITRPFYLGATAVTVGQFRRFVEAAGYRTEAERDGKGDFGWDEQKGKWVQDPKYSWRSPGFEQTDEHPVVFVSWNDATAFCEWLSRQEGQTYRLPTEAEWEYACRAGTTTRYWSGDDPELLATAANVADATARAKFPEWETIAAQDGYVFTAPVGRFRANAWGLYDMHGNVWEWCSDGYRASYYGQTPVDDPPGFPRAPDRVNRGGCWDDTARLARSANRGGNTPGSRNDHLGFRVARAPSGR